jgi:phospho-N-acetylmuramoyl-pentapeptide-transferase
MGDTGSLRLGRCAGRTCHDHQDRTAADHHCRLFRSLRLYVCLIQQVAVRTGHKKVFVYTPIHYAFRIKGMPETSIVLMFWAVEAVFAALGLVIYML